MLLAQDAHTARVVRGNLVQLEWEADRVGCSRLLGGCCGIQLACTGCSAAVQLGPEIIVDCAAGAAMQCSEALPCSAAEFRDLDCPANAGRGSWLSLFAMNGPALVCRGRVTSSSSKNPPAHEAYRPSSKRLNQS